MPHAASTYRPEPPLAECLRHVEQITDGVLDTASEQVRELVALQLEQAANRLRHPRPVAPVNLIPESMR